MLRFTRSCPVLGAFVIAAVAAGCSDQAAVTAPARSLSPSASVSRDAVPVSGTHIFALQKGVPSNFAALVAAKGGQVQFVQNQSKIAITSGLSDADAAALATSVGGLVGADMSARWVPTAQEMNVSASTDVTATGQFTQSPLAAQVLSLQWNMQQIHAPEAWAAGKTGSPSVRVAILDTGLDPNHQELFGVVDGSVSANCLSDKVPCVVGGTSWYDDYFHGTYVGGIVSANNFVTAAMAPNVRLVAVKVLDSTGTGSFSAILRGVMYAVDKVHARVINMSLGATFKGNTPGLLALQQALANVIDYADSQGTVVVTAAGNDDLNLGNPHPHLSLPCEAGQQICVSATDPRDMIARYSNFGRAAIDVSAPGGDDKHLPRNATQADFFSYLIIGPCSGATPHSACYVKGRPIGFSYVFADGTSASAPHVAGLAALIASQPGANSMTAADIRSRIRATADDIGNQSKYGDGRINVATALGVATTTP